MAAPLSTPQAAWDILGRELAPLETEELPLEEAAGRWLAEPLRADRDLPPASRSAMDGFALRAADLAKAPARLEVVGEVAAGAAVDPPLPPGTCVRIFTGANLPTNADTVVPVEQTSSRSFHERPDDATIEIAAPVTPGEHIFTRGENARAGQELLPAGTRLGPRQLGVAVAVGRDRVLVHRLPAVRILNTGEELLELGEPAAPHQTRNSNGPSLRAALRAAGLADVERSVVRDSLAATTEALTAALAAADAVILTGGISAGSHDHVPAAVDAAGGVIAFRGVAMKPGKPQLFARTAAGKCVFGLPGNPLSSIVGLHEFVLPALRRLAGCPLDRCRPELVLPLGEAVVHRGDRQLLLPAVLEVDQRGTRLLPRPPVGSSDLVTGGLADGAIILPPAVGELTAGDPVRFRPWGEVAW